MKNKIIVLIALFLISQYSIDVFAGNEDKPKKEAPTVTLTSSNYDKEISNGLVLVDFWASWCGPCRRIAPILEEIATEYKDAVKIGKLNVDNYKKFAMDKGIQALPTIIVYKDGKELTRIVGLVSKDKLVDLIKENSK